MQIPCTIVERPIASLKPGPHNARTHSKKQIGQIKRSIERFGFTAPALISDEGEIVCGHGRVAAAKDLGWLSVPTIALSHLSTEDRRAYMLADNKLALNAGWDTELLAIEFQALVEMEFDLGLTGFDQTEIDIVIEGANASDPDGCDDAWDAIPALPDQAVSQPGQSWQLGRHRLLCGDAQQVGDVERLMNGEKASIAFLDPPYNVRIAGHVSSNEHSREFAFASGEMTGDQFTEFLAVTLGHVANQLADGAIAFVCMDWRHMGELITAGKRVFTELKNVVVWNKGSGGQGAFYRSQHELIFVFKNGTAPHINNFGLGEGGRSRSNLWTYRGLASFGHHRQESLAIHPTVKPLALVADALHDCSKRGDVVVDTFGGSGTTLIAAEKTGRKARLMEYDPLYCDTIISRWQHYTGKQATLVETGETFEERKLASSEEGGR